MTIKKFSNIAIFVLLTVASKIPKSFADTRSYMISEVVRVPTLLASGLTKPDNPGVLAPEFATCFGISINFKGKEESYVLSNLHPFVRKDSSGAIIARTDTGRIYRNAGDTVISLRVRIFKSNPQLDLALLEVLDSVPLNIEKGVLIFNLEEPDSDLPVGERILYFGFPKMYVDTIKQMYPFVLSGQIARNVPGSDYIVVQSPVFKGASGSPVISETSIKVVGVIFGLIPNQESLALARKTSRIKQWIKKALSQDESR